jgi:hypothetical protein
MRACWYPTPAYRSSAGLGVLGPFGKKGARIEAQKNSASAYDLACNPELKYRPLKYAQDIEANRIEGGTPQRLWHLARTRLNAVSTEKLLHAGRCDKRRTRLLDLATITQPVINGTSSSVSTR